jgi:hypothetical protein
MIGTIWDDDVFNFSTSTSCLNGSNIAIEGIGDIDYQYIPSETSPLIPGTRDIPTISPGFGEIVYTQTPNLVWGTTGSRLSAVAIWNVPPEATVHGIQNTDNLIWFWHSGLSSGVAGSVQYSHGYEPDHADIMAPGLVAKPLTVGRSYYWAAWEWDQAGINVTASTNVSYFRVSSSL